jgi:hypothetical protein
MSPGGQFLMSLDRHTDTYELRASAGLAVWSQATELPKASATA